jgi:predicted O-linked N-acetylglucosamine transferase (SPINDLY family)
MNVHEQRIIQRARTLHLKGDNLAALNQLMALDKSSMSCDSLILLGLCHSELGQHSDAIAGLERAIMLEPDNPRCFYNLGFVAMRANELEVAEKNYLKTISLDHDHAGAYNNLALVYEKQKKLSEAERVCREGVAIIHDSFELYNTLGGLLTVSSRAAQALEQYRKACSINPGNLLARSNILMCMNYIKTPVQDYMRECAGWNIACEQYSQIPPFDYDAAKPSGEKLRLGYFSADFRVHSVAYFMESVIHFHDRERFEVHLFSDVKRPDDVTARFKAMADEFHDVSTLDNPAAARYIRDCGMDVIIDLAGHTGSRLELFARRVAPIQMTYMGYPASSGVDNMDYRLSDELADPPGCEEFFTEKLLRIRGGMWAFSPMADAPDVAPPPCVQNHYFTFGSFNDVAKLSDEAVNCWSAILKEVPRSRLLLKSRHLGAEQLREAMYCRFAAAGVNDRSRIMFAPHTESVAEHLSMYSQVDLALDSFPYNGTTTTFEALWMGVPVLTLAGNNHAARVGQAIISRLGLGSFVAHSRGQFVKAAMAFAAKPETTAQLRPLLRNILCGSGQCDGVRVAHEIERLVLSTQTYHSADT